MENSVEPANSQPEKKHLSKLRIGLTGLFVFLLTIAITIGVLLLLDARREQKETTRFEELGVSTKPLTDDQKVNDGIAPADPKYLSLPSIGVENAPVMALGVLAPDANGGQQMDAPKTTGQVGWYNCQINPVKENRCARPTKPGDGNTETASTMDGHSCFSTTMTCVFDGLPKLRQGDAITVTLGDDSTIDYVVQEVVTVALADVDMAKFMKPITDGKAGLNLITCTGELDAIDVNGRRTADQRVLVYAVEK